MASTRAQQDEILRNQTVLDQLAGSLLSAAQSVINESASATNHTNRLLFANAIIANPNQQAAFMVPALMENATLSGQAGNAAGASGTPFADSDVDYVVSSDFDVYANQYAQQFGNGAALNFG